MVDVGSGRGCEVIIDGGCSGNPGEMRVGVILKGEDEEVMYKKSYGWGTSNRAEWLAFIDGLRIAGALGYSEVRVISDSELLVNQWNGEYRVRDEKLRELFQTAKKLAVRFNRVEVVWVGRDGVEAAHRLAGKYERRKRWVERR
jgi:ribonuclease HI